MVFVCVLVVRIDIYRKEFLMILLVIVYFFLLKLINCLIKKYIRTFAIRSLWFINDAWFNSFMVKTFGRVAEYDEMIAQIFTLNYHINCDFMKI